MTLASLVQPRKAELPMLVTESGIVMLTRLVHPKKALLGILVVPSGMATAPLLSGWIQQAVQVTPQHKAAMSPRTTVAAAACAGEPRIAWMGRWGWVGMGMSAAWDACEDVT